MESTAGETFRADVSGTVRHLVHELRQPLSGIESIAYYLEMVLPELGEDARQQFGRLRQMVQQANWILEDAVLCSRGVEPRREEVSINECVEAFAARVALEDDLNIDLSLDPMAGPASVDPVHLDLLLSKSLEFFREVAECREPIELSTLATPPGFVTIDFQVEIDTDPVPLCRLLDPTPCGDSEDVPAGSLRKLTEANGGAFQLTSEEEGRLALRLRFPAI